MTRENIPEEVRQLSERLVRREMQRFGLRDVRVAAARDHDGDPVLYIDAEYADNGDPVDPTVVTRLLDELSAELIALGEDRFPHIRHHFTEKQKVVGYR